MSNDYTPTNTAPNDHSPMKPEEFRYFMLMPGSEEEREFDLMMVAHNAKVAREAKVEALKEAAERTDREGHLWSGAPSVSFFKLADSLRACAAEIRKGAAS